MTAITLAGCETAPKQVATATIPDLPWPDEGTLMKRPGNPGCVKDRSPTISVKTLASERDCFKDHSFAVQDQLVALQDSVTSVKTKVDQLRASQRVATK
ncbi:MAG: hypothetical protein ABL908_07915 [Hyphomicrobium sp.]